MQVRSVNAYRSLLVYCDGSPEADEAVIAAAELARRDHARLTVAAVAELERPSIRCGMRTNTWNDVLRDAATADLERAARLLDWEPELSLEQGISDTLACFSRREAVLGIA